MPSPDQLIRCERRIPVLVYEKVKKQRFLLINRYANRLVFAGRLNLSAIVLCGMTAYWCLNGYHRHIADEFLRIMAAAKLDDQMYTVTDWNRKNGRLLVYVQKEATPRTENMRTESVN